MSRATAQVRSPLASVLYALAVFFFAFAPTMDAFAKEEALDVAPTFAERVLAAFDVLDDVLDHMPGHAPAAAQHHVQIPEAAETLIYDAGPLTVLAVVWPAASSRIPAGLTPTPLDHPPRS